MNDVVAKELIYNIFPRHKIDLNFKIGTDNMEKWKFWKNVNFQN